jgi:hypothetical protein
VTDVQTTIQPANMCKVDEKTMFPVVKEEPEAPRVVLDHLPNFVAASTRKVLDFTCYRCL